MSELETGDAPLGLARWTGGGRIRLVDLDPGLRMALLSLVEPDMRGDPMSPLRWTTKSTRRLAGGLTRRGWQISADTVADVLRAEGFSLRANAKTLEGSQHPDRGAQFRYLNEQVRAFRDHGQPVISVDHPASIRDAYVDHASIGIAICRNRTMLSGSHAVR